MSHNNSLANRNIPLQRGSQKSSRRRLRRFIIALVILAGLAGTGFFGWRYQQSQANLKKLADPQAAASAELEQITSEVSKLFLVPNNEKPTLATVSDPSKLKSQTFFANAQAGDKLLIYSQAKRAVLYRPSTKQIVEIAPINIGDAPAATPKVDGDKTDTPTPADPAPTTEQ